MKRMWRLRQLSSVLLSVGLLSVGPAMTVPVTVNPPRAGATGESGPGQPPGPVMPPTTGVRRLDWADCTRFLLDTPDIPDARCATVPVPVDYDNPDGAHAELALIRIPATGPRIGSLLINPGGPGASAVDTVAAMAADLTDTEITRHFDLVGFDPRGVGHSTPELRCRTDAEFDAYRREPLVDYSPAGVAHIEQLYRQLARRCAERMGPGFLRNIGTASVVRDMEVIRQALGDEQLNYLGYSYGTALGTAYVERFPDHVRAMVLDGAIDPSVDPVQQNIDQMAGFQTAFNDYAADCARSPQCPLGTDPAKAVDAYHRLVDPLVDKPGKTSDPRGLSYADATTGTINALYTPRFWKYLTRGLQGLQRGTDADDLLLLADDYQGRDAHGHYSNGQDAFNAIRCVDAPAPPDAAAWVAADRRIRQVAPFLSYGLFTGSAPRDLCALWPVPATSAPHRAAPVAAACGGAARAAAQRPASRCVPKVVVVSTTHDPATPYQAGVSLARQLGAPLITHDGTRHTAVFTGVRCVDAAVVRYLVDGVPPPDDSRC
ncbi:MAG: alpha/beta hydrolase [Mycobacterium sp.]|uniref:alpha/beta hydrolase n=1 Tax=Mycobacterium sp. TaxID=1785 RepID=UPI00260E97C0|nr:alpha/beta hydrolase [Mycobacterium sp.]MDI3313738.1 alpha/beta hydrolase [Mycobacterium sp.]